MTTRIGRRWWRRWAHRSRCTSLKLTAGKATSLRPEPRCRFVTSAGTAPVFGAVWLTGHFSTDKAERIVSFYDVKVPAVRFPNATEEKQQQLIEILEDELDDWVYDVDLDVLLPSLELAERDALGDADLKHDVPKNHR